jgi:hypothetical protein
VHQRHWGSVQLPDLPPECGGDSVALPRVGGATDDGDRGRGRCTRCSSNSQSLMAVGLAEPQSPLRSEIQSIRLG